MRRLLERSKEVREGANMGELGLEFEIGEVKRLLERFKVEMRCQIGAGKLELVRF